MKNFTTKLLAIGISAVLLTSAFTACQKTKEAPEQPKEQTVQPEEEEQNTHIGTGSWAAAEDTTVTDELRAIFEEAISKVDGYFFESVALLGTQVVAGTNYAILCQPTIVAHDATGSYVITYINVDPSGEASLLRDDRVVLPGTENIDPSAGMMTGGWAYTESIEITDDIEAVMTKATETLTGASYKAIANIGTQVVAGLNHAILCQVTPVVPDGTATYALVYIYEDLDGNCTITATEDIIFDATGN